MYCTRMKLLPSHSKAKQHKTHKTTPKTTTDQTPLQRSTGQHQDERATRECASGVCITHDVHEPCSPTCADKQERAMHSNTTTAPCDATGVSQDSHVRSSPSRRTKKGKKEENTTCNQNGGWTHSRKGTPQKGNLQRREGVGTGRGRHTDVDVVHDAGDAALHRVRPLRRRRPPNGGARVQQARLGIGRVPAQHSTTSGTHATP